VTINKYALFGKPITLSPSPAIHQYFANTLADSIDYHKVEISVADFEDAVIKFFKQGGSGLNITVPHKQSAYELADVTTTAAKNAKAVNTLWKVNGKIFGDNTDGIGFIKDCTEKNIVLSEKKVLILGAGGAVRGILGPLLEHLPAQVVIANRTQQKARNLAEDFSAYKQLSICPLDAISDINFDLVINALSLHYFPDDLNFKLQNPSTYYDLKYAEAAESGINWASQQSFTLITDGWGMLLKQAAESYFIWQHKLPITEPLISNPLLLTNFQ